MVPLVSQFKQQSKISETSVEGIVGLELLRTDLEQAGYGLPWYFPDDTITYTEAINAPESSYNDTAGCAPGPGCPPRAFVVGNNLVGVPNIMSGTDYLVIKSLLVAKSQTARKWTSLATESLQTPRQWGSPTPDHNYDLAPGADRVIVIKPKMGDTRVRELAMNGAIFFTKYASAAFPSSFSPTQPQEAYLIYGVDPSADLKMPFNRADYYVSTANVPTRCATGTGVLVKAVLSHVAGIDYPAQNVTPLLDCVADMQVVLGLDMGSPGGGTNPNGVVGTYTDSNGLNIANGAEVEVRTPADVLRVMSSANEIRNRLLEIRVYILAHEGQRDPNYQFNNFNCGANCVTVGDYGCGRAFNLVANGIANWQNYRWKVYTLVVKPQDLR
jgi:hypothetical protein